VVAEPEEVVVPEDEEPELPDDEDDEELAWLADSPGKRLKG